MEFIQLYSAWGLSAARSRNKRYPHCFQSCGGSIGSFTAPWSKATSKESQKLELSRKITIARGYGHGQRFLHVFLRKKKCDQSILFRKTRGEKLFRSCVRGFWENFAFISVYFYTVHGSHTPLKLRATKNSRAVKVYRLHGWDLLSPLVLETRTFFLIDKSARSGVILVKACGIDEVWWVASQFSTLPWCYLAHSVSSATVPGRCVWWRHASLC